MKGSPEVIKVLNEVLRKELTGINQYFVHSKMGKNWGFEVLAGVHWKESIDEMKHADSLVERILFLEGVPNVAAYDKISVGATMIKVAV
jgi:bacterioferritin